MPMGKVGSLPCALKANTQRGVVNVPSPPPKPAFERPMNNTPKAARRIVVRSDTGADVKRSGSKGKQGGDGIVYQNDSWPFCKPSDIAGQRKAKIHFFVRMDAVRTLFNRLQTHSMTAQ